MTFPLSLTPSYLHEVFYVHSVFVNNIEVYLPTVKKDIIASINQLFIFVASSILKYIWLITLVVCNCALCVLWWILLFWWMGDIFFVAEVANDNYSLIVTADSFFSFWVMKLESEVKLCFVFYCIDMNVCRIQQCWMLLIWPLWKLWRRSNVYKLKLR